jgi:hypothetical protein
MRGNQGVQGTGGCFVPSGSWVAGQRPVLRACDSMSSQMQSAMIESQETFLRPSCAPAAVGARTGSSSAPASATATNFMWNPDCIV